MASKEDIKFLKKYIYLMEYRNNPFYKNSFFLAFIISLIIISLVFFGLFKLLPVDNINHLPFLFIVIFVSCAPLIAILNKAFVPFSSLYFNNFPTLDWYTNSGKKKLRVTDSSCYLDGEKILGNEAKKDLSLIYQKLYDERVVSTVEFIKQQFGDKIKVKEKDLSGILLKAKEEANKIKKENFDKNLALLLENATDEQREEINKKINKVVSEEKVREKVKDLS